MNGVKMVAIAELVNSLSPIDTRTPEGNYLSTVVSKADLVEALITLFREQDPSLDGEAFGYACYKAQEANYYYPGCGEYGKAKGQ